MDAPVRVSSADIETTVGSLKGVLSVRAVPASDGSVEELHVLADGDRAPKQIVRDVESALMAQYGLELDHKVISVAQTQSGKQFRFNESRLKFSDVAISLNGTRAEATVRLSRNGDVYTGNAVGHSSTQSQYRLVATATLEALERCRGTEGTLVVEDLDWSVTLLGKNVVLALVNMITPRGEEYLTGSAIVKQDLWKAVVNATLDAVNRRLGVAAEE